MEANPPKAAMQKVLIAMYAARESVMHRCGTLYAPTICPLRKILKQEQRRFGLSPIEAMAMHVQVGKIDDLSLKLWLAATAEEYLEQAAAEPTKAVG